MTTCSKVFHLSFPQALINEPILHNISNKFGVMFNILEASVTAARGSLVLQLSAEEERLAEALDYLRQRGVDIEECPQPVSA